MKNTHGQNAYIEDVRRRPKYHDGTPRKTWEQLSPEVQGTWEKNPTQRFVDVSNIQEYGLTQKLSNSIRCF